MKETEAMKAMYQNRDSAEVIGKILKCRYSIVQPHSGVHRKNGFFPIVPQYGKVHRKIEACQQIIQA